MRGRTSIALGATLYEMLMGEPPFTGPTAQAIVAKVISAQPERITTYRKVVSPGLEAVTITALQKLPADRFATAAEFAAALKDPTATASTIRAVSSSKTRNAGVMVAVAFAALFAGWLLGSIRGGDRSSVVQPSRLAILAPQLGGSGGAVQQTMLSITGDGSAIAYVVEAEGVGNQIMWHPLDALEPTPVPDVEGRFGPRVSVDGRWLVTSGIAGERRRLRQVPVAGGSQKSIRMGDMGLASIPQITWHSDGSVYVSSASGDELLRLSPDADSLVLVLDGLAGATLTDVLPEGRRGLLVRAPAGNNSGPLELIDLESGETRTLIAGAVVDARHTDGYLVYVLSNGTLEVVPFDVGAAEITGGSVALASDVSLTGTGYAQFDASDNGTVVYIPEEPRELILMDRDGRQRVLSAARQNYHSPMFSPDGQRVAVDFNSLDGRDVWVLDLRQQTMSRLTFDSDGHDPTWSLDGRWITYTSSKSGTFGVYVTPSTIGSGEPRLLAEHQDLAFTGYWLPRDSTLLTIGSSIGSASSIDLVLMRFDGEPRITPLVASPFQDFFPAVSPDGEYLAFVSTRSGDNEVYVRPIHREGGGLQVSNAGGTEPAWGPDGETLYYRHERPDGSPLHRNHAVGECAGAAEMLWS